MLVERQPQTETLAIILLVAIFAMLGTYIYIIRQRDYAMKDMMRLHREAEKDYLTVISILNDAGAGLDRNSSPHDVRVAINTVDKSSRSSVERYVVSMKRKANEMHSLDVHGEADSILDDIERWTKI